MYKICLTNCEDETKLNFLNIKKQIVIDDFKRNEEYEMFIHSLMIQNNLDIAFVFDSNNLIVARYKNFNIQFNDINDFARYVDELENDNNNDTSKLFN